MEEGILTTEAIYHEWYPVDPRSEFISLSLLKLGLKPVTGLSTALGESWRINWSPRTTYQSSPDELGYSSPRGLKKCSSYVRHGCQLDCQSDLAHVIRSGGAQDEEDHRSHGMTNIVYLFMIRHFENIIYYCRQVIVSDFMKTEINPYMFNNETTPTLYILIIHI